MNYHQLWTTVTAILMVWSVIATGARKGLWFAIIWSLLGVASMMSVT